MTKKKIHNYVFDTTKQLGRGQFGTVYKGRLYNSNERVAIKVLNKVLIDKNPYLKESFILEIKTLKKIQSPNIVGFKDVIESDNNYYIVQQFCDGGDFENILKEKGKIPQKQAIGYMIEVLTGFYDIMRCGIVHRDFKPQNILISQGKLKIADFGLARPSGQQLSLRSEVGTPVYQSPQTLKGESYSYKCDIWAIGMVFYEMLYGDLPWQRKNGKTGYLKEIQTKKLSFPKEPQVSEQVKEFISKCLKIPQQTRMQWQQIFECNLFAGKLPTYQVLEQKFAYALQQISRNVHQNCIDLQKLYTRYKIEKPDNQQDDGMTRKDFRRMLRQLAPDVKSKHVDFVISKFDKNSNGLIQFDQFTRTIQSEHSKIINLRPKQLKLIFFRMFEQQKDNIQQMRATTWQKLSKRIQVKYKKIGITNFEIFNKFNIDKSMKNKLNEENFTDLMKFIDPQISKDECYFLFRQFDNDGDNTIKYNQFFKNMQRLVGPDEE